MTWVVLCACGWARAGLGTAGAADRADAYHKVEGVEGADHVTSIEYRDARIVGSPTHSKEA